ncbi:hypothetical protein GGX14DRAFT_588082 [Mycena pura]|uniref:Uncharacterized protein n=1 Tax=Mycena pura TaxID=153505 RepID=A0AAD6UU81_9AGAR|nr:hypothetical protein GGX14DRAFT_588082 [Mycena pura]
MSARIGTETESDLPTDNTMISITHEAPKLIQNQIAAWSTTAQNAAVVTALFSTNAATILSIVRSDGALTGKDGKVMTLLIFASYGAMLFNSITTLASWFFIDALGDIERNVNTRIAFVPRTISSLQLLENFGASPRIKRIFRQC